MNDFFTKIKDNWASILELLCDRYEISDVIFEAYLEKPLTLISYDENSKTLNIEVVQEGYLPYLNKNLLIPLRVSIADFLNVSLDEVNIKFFVKNSESEIDNKENLSKNDIEYRLKNLGVNPSFTFESFVQGPTNELAYATSIAVSELPGGMHNPLFIYGGTGLGKTHLLSAIAHHALLRNPNLNVVYKTCESFKNESIQSIAKNKTQEFRDIYRNADILIVDDIQALIGANNTQEEFFNTFNALYQNKKQIVIASDKPPKDLDGIEDRLKSRFSMGAICDVKLPDYETRIAILRRKEEEYKSEFSIDTQVINFIAQKIQSNIRELEGCLKKVILKSRLDKKPVNLDQAKKILSDLTKEENKKITPDLIIKTVANYYNVDILEMCGKKRNNEFKTPRNICIYLCRELIKDITQEKIGSYFSNRDHATVINSCKNVDDRLKKEIRLKEDIDAIKKRMLVV